MKTATPTATRPTSRKSSYDPGVPGRIEPEGNARYLVEAFRNPGDWYSVDLAENTCTCPHSTHRNAADCKHRRAARLQAFKDAKVKAQSLDLDTLKNLLLFKDYRPEVTEAIEFTLWERERGAALIQEIATL
jgi:uncharacterized Zn finger protein